MDIEPIRTDNCFFSGAGKFSNIGLLSVVLLITGCVDSRHCTMWLCSRLLAVIQCPRCYGAVRLTFHML